MEKILSIDLATQTSPKVSEHQNKDWIEYGTDDWANLYPQFLIDLYYNSSTHAAIINATRDMIAGEGIMCEEHEDIEKHTKLKNFLKPIQNGIFFSSQDGSSIPIFVDKVIFSSRNI